MLPEILQDEFCVVIGLALAGLGVAICVLIVGLCVFGGVMLGMVVYETLLSPFFRLILRKACHCNKLYGDHEIIKLQSNINSLKHNAHIVGED